MNSCVRHAQAVYTRRAQVSTYMEGFMVIAEPHEQGNPSVRCRSLAPCDSVPDHRALLCSLHSLGMYAPALS